MNGFERKTLDYLLTLETEEEWQAWAATQDPEDFLRVLNIIRRAQSENLVALMELEENQLTDFSQAQSLLQRF